MNDFVKPKDQREFIRFGLARNRTVKNVFVKPNEQSSSLLEYSAMARKRLLKTNDFVKPKDQREFIRFGLARNRTVKNYC